MHDAREDREGDDDRHRRRRAPLDAAELPESLTRALAGTGYEVTMDWFAYAQRALRDDILRELADNPEARAALRIDPDVQSGPEGLPSRIRGAVRSRSGRPKSAR